MVGNLLLTIPVSAPLLSVSPPTNIVANGAKLLGEVTQSGGADANVTVHWGIQCSSREHGGQSGLSKTGHEQFYIFP